MLVKMMIISISIQSLFQFPSVFRVMKFDIMGQTTTISFDLSAFILRKKKKSKNALNFNTIRSFSVYIHFFPILCARGKFEKERRLRRRQ